MKVSFEYGQGMVDAVLPDNTDIFIPGETVPDPPCIPEDKLEEETLKSIRNPMGMPPVAQLGCDYFPGYRKRGASAYGTPETLH